MRSITDHRLEEGGFNESIQGLVSSSPWWMISLVVHGIAALILWNVPFSIKNLGDPRLLQAVNTDDENPEDEPPPEEPPEEPEDEITEEVLEEDA